MNRIGVLIVLMIVAFVSCTEKYIPSVQNDLDAIVVEGLLTNLKESYKVKISMATPYDSLLNTSKVSGAKVSIKDDLGNEYQMHENHYEGYYYSDTSEFTAAYGRLYILHIEMPDGNVYESSPQKLNQSPAIDSIYANVANKDFYYKNELGDFVTKKVYGTETFMDFSYHSDSIFQFRFENTLMICFAYWYLYTPEMKEGGMDFPPPREGYPGPYFPYIIYNWKKFDLNTSLNLSATTNTFSQKKIRKASVSFFPLDSAYFPVNFVADSCGYNKAGQYACGIIRSLSGLHGKILQTKVYALNQVASTYYQEINKQLSSEGKIFDPIAVQLKGNMRCITNPEKKVLGLFEVSSCTSESAWLIFYYDSGNAKYLPVNDISNVSTSGSSKKLPDFWIINQ